MGRKKDLARHVKGVHDQNIKKHQCPICQKEYTRLDNLHRHMSARHGGVQAKWAQPRTTLFNKEINLSHSTAAAPPYTDSGYASGGHKQRTFLEDDFQKPPQLGEMTSSDIPDSQNWESGEYDARTIYGPSDTSSLPHTAHDKYISDLALDIFNVLKESWSDRKTLERICDELPDLLCGFALKMGYHGQTQIERDISYFVQRHRLYVSCLRRYTNLSI
jgi:hypothetical protein